MRSPNRSNNGGQRSKYQTVSCLTDKGRGCAFSWLHEFELQNNINVLHKKVHDHSFSNCGVHFASCTSTIINEDAFCVLRLCFPIEIEVSDIYIYIYIYMKQCMCNTVHRGLQLIANPRICEDVINHACKEHHIQKNLRIWLESSPLFPTPLQTLRPYIHKLYGDLNCNLHSINDM